MRPFTETIPKPMLPVLNRPFLEHQIHLLRENGLRKFLLLVGYLGDRIEDHFGTGAEFGVEILYSYEGTPLGTGGALKQAVPLLEETFLVVNGDTLLDIDYRTFISDFEASGKMAMLAAYRNVKQEIPSNLKMAEDGVIIEYGKRQPTGDYIDAGVLALRKTVLDFIPSSGKCSLEEEIFPKLIDKGELKGWPTAVAFFDMGTPAGLAALEAHLR